MRCLRPLLLIAAMAPAASVASTPPPSPLLDAHLQADATERTDGTTTLQLDLDGHPARLSLSPDSALEASAARSVPAIASGHQRLYAGQVEGIDASWVRVSREGDAWYGVVFDGRGYWTLAPATEWAGAARAAGVAQDAHVVLRGDAAWQVIDMHGDALQAPPAAIASRGGNAAAKRGSVYTLGLSLVLDTEFQTRFANPSSRAASIINIVDGYYERTTNTSVYLNDLRLLPAGNAGMTGADTTALLEQLTAYVQTPAAPDFQSATHLLSGKESVGGGLAYLGSLCSPTYATGVNAAKYDVGTSAAVLAHELGHNYGADHDGSGVAAACPNGQFVMETTITVGDPEEDFSTCSIAVFAAEAPGYACLAGAGPGGLFADGFED